MPYHHLVLIVSALALFATPSMAQETGPKPPPGVSEQLQSILGGALTSPPKQDAPAASTRFTPAGELLFFDSMVTQMTLDAAQKEQFRNYVGQLPAILSLENVPQN